MPNNIESGRLNPIVYMGNSPGRLAGTLQSGEVSLSTVFTSARIRTIYESKTGGGFNSFNPTSPNFSSLKVLQPGKAYMVEPKLSFEFDDCLPHPDPAFQATAINWFAANKPGGTGGGGTNMDLGSGSLYQLG